MRDTCLLPRWSSSAATCVQELLECSKNKSKYSDCTLVLSNPTANRVEGMIWSCYSEAAVSSCTHAVFAVILRHTCLHYLRDALVPRAHHKLRQYIFAQPSVGLHPTASNSLHSAYSHRSNIFPDVRSTHALMLEVPCRLSYPRAFPNQKAMLSAWLMIGILAIERIGSYEIAACSTIRSSWPVFVSLRNNRLYQLGYQCQCSSQLALIPAIVRSIEHNKTTTKAASVDPFPLRIRQCDDGIVGSVAAAY